MDWWPVSVVLVSGYLLRVVQEHLVARYPKGRAVRYLEVLDQMLGLRK